MPEFIERQECPECGVSPEYLGEMHKLGCSRPAYVIVRYVRERQPDRPGSRTTVRRLIAHLQQLPPEREIVTTFEEVVATEDQVACAELLIGALSENETGRCSCGAPEPCLAPRFGGRHVPPEIWRSELRDDAKG